MREFQLFYGVITVQLLFDFLRYLWLIEDGRSVEHIGDESFILLDIVRLDEPVHSDVAQFGNYLRIVEPTEVARLEEAHEVLDSHLPVLLFVLLEYPLEQGEKDLVIVMELTTVFA